VGHRGYPARSLAGVRRRSEKVGSVAGQPSRGHHQFYQVNDADLSQKSRFSSLAKLTSILGRETERGHAVVRDPRRCGSMLQGTSFEARAIIENSSPLSARHRCALRPQDQAFGNVVRISWCSELLAHDARDIGGIGIQLFRKGCVTGRHATSRELVWEMH
jgi:hypothetical protein